MKYLIFVLLTAWFHIASGATYYVATTGNNANPGSIASPWLTIAKASTTMVAGDTVIIGDGDYNEHVEESTAGTAGNPITYRAENAGMASLRAFRLRAAYITLDGLKINKFSGVNNTWGGAVRVESAANNFVITNCIIRDMPYVLASDVSFDHTTNKVISLSSDFVTAGFVTGSKVYLGASGTTVNGSPLYYTNHDTEWVVDTVTTTSMTLLNGTNQFLEDTGSDYWAFIRCGSGSEGYNAIVCIVSGGVGPANGEISNNTITNWAGHAMEVTGTGHLVEGNTCSALKSFRFLLFKGSNHIIRNNIVKDCAGVLHYSEGELALLEHPNGTGWYDYQVGMIGGFTITGTHINNLIENNWFENLENQLGRVDDELPTAYGITYNNNVFVGVSAHFSGGRDDMNWTNNTFFRCAWNTAAHPLQIGGRAPEQPDYNIENNLFIACGAYGTTETLTRGFYGISSNAITPVTDYNMVASEEVTGYLAKTSFAESNGVNGGDPVFLDPLDPMGPDDLPFTADDGLQVLPNSPAAALGGGACGVYSLTNNVPVAHFRITNPVGWFEPVGDQYNPEWFTILPYNRTGPQRPYTTPVTIGAAPLEVTFNAEKSISAVALAETNTAITSYSWDFDDGNPPTVEADPSVTHTFSTSGDKEVTLTVTNSAAGTHSITNIYRITGDSPSAPTNLREL